MEVYAITWTEPYSFHSHSTTVEAFSPEQAVWNMAKETWLNNGQIHERSIVEVTKVSQKR